MVVNMKTIKINSTSYNVLKDDANIINEEELNEKCTDYFNDFDLIVGDMAYGKLRLKGFYKSKNKNIKDYNDEKNIDKYIIEKCAYGCKYFVIEKGDIV